MSHAGHRFRLAFALVTMSMLAAAWPSESRADDAPEPSKRAVFALVIGSNVSVDAELPALKYADDDAARYVDLFRLLGARTYLLTRPDANTSRLHAQATAEAQPPRLAELEVALAHAAADVAQARARHVETVFYFLYAGHGSVRNGEGYLGLEDIGASDLPARKVMGFGALGLGAVAVGVTYGVLGVVESSGGSATEAQRDVANRNDRIARDRTASIVGLSVGGALLATGVVVLLWPSAPKAVRGASAIVTPSGAHLGFGGAF